MPGTAAGRARHPGVPYFVVVNFHVAEPEPAPFDPVDRAAYVVPFRRRVDGVKVTVVHGELQAVAPLTCRPLLSVSVRLDAVSGSS